MRLAGDLDRGDVAFDDPLAGVDQHERDVRPLRRRRARAAPSSTRSPAAACACVADRRCRSAGTSVRRARAPCRWCRASCPAPRTRSSAPRRRACCRATTCRRSGDRGWRRGSRPPDAGASTRPAAGRGSRRGGRRCSCRAAPESGNGSPKPEPVELERERSPATGRRSCSRATSTSFFASRRIWRELLVAGRDTGARIDDEEHEVGLLDRSACLPRDRCVTGSGSAMSTPPVSISRNCRPFHSQTSSLRSRVVPCVSCTTAARVAVSRLTRVDFPTFGKPTIATVPSSCFAHTGGVSRRGRPSAWSPRASRRAR